ncbi:hypothetical protein HBI56_131810 [Parastagonospora nodorum]|nr:hypothetical protein HBH53_218620 [Parastagonospora nodorum]KAH3971941.1 hypothetical protein HBH51_107990 [Parastagonospora nodorum]KAH3996610.1 hypothetical protein HBI10_153730 [Parastagonospora nodorum]KAH4012602.1 hypothetical protein HBI13_188420 [Parastagonospora nodorum]KAH4029610.1 hypothetical protein HBI09_135540 [Parastagonospora nodorum]
MNFFLEDVLHSILDHIGIDTETSTQLSKRYIATFVETCLTPLTFHSLEACVPPPPTQDCVHPRVPKNSQGIVTLEHVGFCVVDKRQASIVEGFEEEKTVGKGVGE